MPLQVKQTIPLRIKRLGINGEGIGFYKKTLVFVEGALKGEDILCQVTAVKRNFAQARLLKINKRSKYRIQPACPVYDSCGGCQIMHLRYDQQLDFKTDLLGQALKKFKPAGYEYYDIRPTIGMENPNHYRAKLQFQIRRFKDKVVAGLYRQSSHHLIELRDCLVQDPLTQAIINKVTMLLTRYDLPIYDERRKKAGLRTVMIRKAEGTGQVQLIFVASKPVHLDRIIKELTEAFPQIVTVAFNLNTSKSSDIYGEQTSILWGRPAIQERVLDYDFVLSPRAFYQLNPKQTAILYTEAIKALEPTSDDHVIDAYCGSGTIGLAFAKQVKTLRGMDIIPEAIKDAQINAKRLGLDNTYYETGPAESIIPQWYADGYRADALIVDPPRTGLDKKLMAAILKYQPPKMVYVSCNVSTLARDLVQLTKIYEVVYIQSVDMFPNTARTEAVVKLVRPN